MRTKRVSLTVSIAPVDLDTIESNVKGSFGGLDKVRSRLCNMLLCHLDRREVLVRDLLSRGSSKGELLIRLPRRGAGADHLAPCHLRYRGPSRMPELGVDVAAFGMHSVHDLLPACRLGLVEDSGDIGHAACLEGRRDALGDQQATGRSALAVVKRDDIVRDPNALDAFERDSAVAGHRRHNHAMIEGDLSIGDGQGTEELRRHEVDDGSIEMPNASEGVLCPRMSLYFGKDTSGAALPFEVYQSSDNSCVAMSAAHTVGMSA